MTVAPDDRRSRMAVRQTSPHRRRLGILVGLALLLPTTWAPASADPVEEKKAEAVRLATEIDADGAKASAAAERYNRAQLELDGVRSSLDKARAELARADERLRSAKGLMAQAAVLAYVHGGSNSVLSQLVRSDHGDLVLRQQYLRFTAADQRDVLGRFRLVRQEVTANQARLSGEERAAASAASTADAARRSAADAEASLRARLNKVKGEMADLVAAESARRAAAAPPPAARNAAGGPAQAASPKPAARSLTPSGPPPPTARGAAAAVAEAERQIGKPYKWGGAGPDNFDCSGLTAWAWRAGGVTLTHSALAQYNQTPRVAPSDMQPGDLLFFGPNVAGIHHNAIYIGGGQMVEASQTGTPVRYRALGRTDLVGVGRPG